MGPASVSIIWECPNSSCLSERTFKIVIGSPSRMVHTLFNMVFALVLVSSESVHELFKSRFSVPCSSIVFLDIFFIGFQSQVFWGLISPV